MNDITRKITDTLRWMKADLDFHRAQTGLDSDPLSPAMQVAGEILADLEAGRIRCERVEP